VQAGDLYRLMSEDEKELLVANIAGPLSAVTRDDVVQRAIGNFRNADPDYGARIAKAVAALKARTRGEEVTIQVGKPAHESSNAWMFISSARLFRRSAERTGRSQ
jgi:catalase